MLNPQSIPIVEAKEDVIYTPFSLFQQWVMNRSFPSKVMYGQREVPVSMQPHPDRKEQYMLSAALCKKLNLLKDQQHHIYEWDGTLHIGPVVGIFTAGFTGGTYKPIGERSSMFAKLLSEAIQLGVTAYVFGTHHIDWNEKKINGYIFDKSGWSQYPLPFPNLVYDRLPNRRIERLPATTETKMKLEQETNMLWFNPGFFNKWSVHELLYDNRQVRNYLPETLNSPEASQIEEMLHRYKNIYVKPTNGSLGIGIQQIIKRRKDPFCYCKFRTDGQNRLRRYTSLKRLLRQQFPKGLEGYMAQRGIHLLNCNGKPIDFRVHTNRNRDGAWEVSAIAAKLAGTGSVTTHVTSGGKILTLQDIVNEMGKSKSITQDIKMAALKLSDSLSEKMEGVIGEIGFDLGVDHEGAIWLFEANAKPGRGIFSHPNLSASDKRTSRLPFEFSIYLYEQLIKRQVPVKR
ncbi:YheC/YheD family protein [Alkalihalobacillus sp. TS-13]|uniref:YheC/YheD family endospore coat-associated protein n=1 Tax=Alkalihalobacillus sp. TS-13 TaxID=2842455 RepID=UPI001C87C507|nr:YheC/YheD family protein [Alkalihalobacillus sp. TS-13]